MELEELQRGWQRLDEKLERTVTMNAELLRLAVVQPARRRMNRLAFWPALDIAGCVMVMLFAGSFLGNHWPVWSLVSPAIGLMAGALLLLLASIRQLIIVSEIDWSGTVAGMQSSLTRLGLLKISQFKWTILLSPLVGFCGMIVGLQWLLDRLPEQHFILDKLNPWWVAANYAFGVLFVPIGRFVVAFLAGRFHSRGWWQRALDDLSGTSVKRSLEELTRWGSLDGKAANNLA
ncbi:hypothetical protein BH10PLA2_BH10PLA2_34440 [soil metagenome]